jgi:Mannosyl-glycoprotein endo-beta-N-acetylglucosaminidase
MGRRTIDRAVARARRVTSLAIVICVAWIPTMRATAQVPPVTTVPPVPPPYVPDLGPPPPGFGFDEDSGRQLLLDQQAARIELLNRHEAIRTAERRIPRLEDERNRRAVVNEIAAHRELLARRAFARSERRLARSVISIYVDSSPANEALESVAQVIEADSVMELSRIDELRRAQREVRARQRDSLVVEFAAATRDAETARVELADHDDVLRAAHRAVVEARYQLRVAEDRIAALDEYQQRWLAAAARTAASPIMGPSALDVDDLVRKALASNPNPRLTVSIEELARLFLEEGAAEGVRGDVAFAQSILETGAFSNPASGSIVVWTDNNFAGIGACDSCEHGRVFATARDGVRAQIQALRTYADPTVDSPDDYANPMVLPKQLDWIRAGKTKIWYELTGKWATGAGYGLHIFDVYRDMYSMRTSPPLSAPAIVMPTPRDGAIAIARGRVDIARRALA